MILKFTAEIWYFRVLGVPVDTLVDYLKGGYDIGEFLKDFPTVTRWQVESYLEVSSKALDHCGDNHA